MYSRFVYSARICLLILMLSVLFLLLLIILLILLLLLLLLLLLACLAARPSAELPSSCCLLAGMTLLINCLQGHQRKKNEIQEAMTKVMPGARVGLYSL